VYGSYAPPLSSPPHLSSTNDVRTLFIAGLPEDVKPREIYNLFREFPGYESSRLRSPNGSSQVYCWCSVMCYCGLLLCFLSDCVCFVTGICFRYFHQSAICNHGIACS
jgi:RNA recognition motif-containing protein